MRFAQLFTGSRGAANPELEAARRARRKIRTNKLWNATKLYD